MTNLSIIDDLEPKALAPVDFTLPDAASVSQRIAEIQDFQALVRSQLIEGKDYGVIPGTQNPTLLKPGAEKIVRLVNCADSYEIMDQVRDWERGFFEYTIKARLVYLPTGQIVAEGVGECNSWESRYRYRWVGERDLKAMGLTVGEVNRLKTRERDSRNGGSYTQWRIENDDPYSLVNTILKMAKKRAMVDVALSVGRLSELFTQDIEDLQANAENRQGSTAQARTAPAKPTNSRNTKQAPKADDFDVDNPEFTDRGHFLGMVQKHLNYSPTAVLGYLSLEDVKDIKGEKNFKDHWTVLMSAWSHENETKEPE